MAGAENACAGRVYATDQHSHFQRAQQAQIDKRAVARSDDSPRPRTQVRVVDRIRKYRRCGRLGHHGHCCHLGEKVVQSNSFNIGFGVELNVTAVHRRLILKAASISIDVETITGRKV